MNKPIKAKDVNARKVASAELKTWMDKFLTDMQARWDTENQEVAEFNRNLLKMNQKAQAAYMMVEAAAMDTMLGDLLKTKMPYLNKTLKVKLFNGNGGPFSNFANKIDTTYAMGIINARTNKDLEAFRQIRNKFAHTQVRLHFDSENVAELFYKFEGYTEGVNRQDFIEGKAAEIRGALTATLAGIAAGERKDGETESQ